jgi:hypothetical protein
MERFYLLRIYFNVFDNISKKKTVKLRNAATNNKTPTWLP